MTEDIVDPPHFAGLIWNDLQATATERFWSLYNHANRDGQRALKAVGITVHKAESGWIVRFDPAVAGIIAAEDVIGTLELAEFAMGRDLSEHQRHVAQVQREEEVEARELKELKRQGARAKLVTRFGAVADPDLITAAQMEARTCWQQWHSFCVSKKRLLEFSAIDARISLSQAVWLTELVDQTAAKAEHVRDNLVASDAAVDWCDDEVVGAVESLCWHDMDQATEENGSGWSKADSSKGHWCHGMIRLGGPNRDIGIDAARAILGKYSRQLKKEAA